MATSGNDGNDGLSRSTPWRTVQKAADTMQPGDTAIVLAGTYNEQVNVSKSGVAGKPITFEADSGATVTNQGFQINANFIQVIGFEISNHNSTEPSMFGVYVVGSNNLISQNYIHDLCAEGVMVSGNGDPNSTSTANNSVINNRMVHCEMAGVQVEGLNNLVQGNDISATAQFPAGCPSRSGADADGLRFFGSGQLVQGNYIHDIQWGTAENPNPHVDCFQTWGPASNITIDRNLCVWPSTSDSTDNEVASIESLDGLSTNITLENNILLDMRQGINVDSGATAINFFNNTFDHILQEGVILSGASNCQIVNNIFYDVGSGGDSYACIDAGSSGTLVASNDHFMPSGTPGTSCSNAAHLTADPLFVDSANLNFRLQPGSPLIDAGTALPSVTTDYYGNARPQGKGYDIGAVEN